MNVKKQGQAISGSPFKINVLDRDIGNSRNVKMSGAGLKEGKTNTANEVIINTKEAGYGGLSVSIEGKLIIFRVLTFLIFTLIF